MMINHTNSQSKVTAYNEAVTKAYYKVLRHAQKLIATLPSYEARCTLELQEQDAFSKLKKHQFVSPMLYLSLEVGHLDKLYIHFGFEQFDSDSVLAAFSTSFVRALYNFTSKPVTAINIEDCVHTNNLVTTCSELFEVIEECEHKRHVFKVIPYKPKAARTKVLKAVA